jgi:primosomal protein N' (replication factor Y) (superfamily II helicase)
VPPPIAQVEPLTTARALRGPFDYQRPEGVGVGSVLVVPFGRRDVVGVVTGLAAASEHEVVAPRRVLEAELPPDLVELALWIAREYASTPARALSLLLPPKGTRAKTALYAVARREPVDGERVTDRQRALLASLPRFTGADTAALRRLEARGLVAVAPRVVRRAPVHVPVGARRERPPLTAEQEAALLAIRAAAPGEGLLLHGVTGSGKTEVYLQAAAETLAGGRTVIVLVPEIALTPQIVARFVQRFGDTVAVLHSKLSDGERHDEWARLRRGEARICVGPRSAVFAPLSDVGLIVVDEEHDPSYKHEGDPRYDARRVAMRRARVAGAVLVAGSATPRPESVHALPRLRLPTRVDGQALPPVEVVDMREAKRALHPRTHDALAGARKAIVLLNRRGWSNFLSCRSCGRAWECPSCDVTLVMHRAEALLACHHCGHREGVPSRCPDCGSVSIARHGTGTERLSDELAVGVPVFRLDGDVRSPAEVLAAFEAAPRGVLVGTQMVAKGHDFPDVDLGVVVDADATLRFPDFRAEERTFALVTQLAGRAGRGSAGGRVLVQTLAPDARSIALAAQHDADAFVAGELEWRAALRYPPFSTLVRIVCSADVGDGRGRASGAGRGAGAGAGRGMSRGAVAGPGAGAAQAAAAAVRARLDGAAGAALGPAPLFRLRGRERSQVVVKATDRRAAVAAIDAAVQAVAADRASRGVSFSVDVDPQ